MLYWPAADLEPWDSFGKTGSNMMFASAPAISVSAADGESGLKSVQYLNSSTGYDSQAALPTEGWKDVDLTEGKGTITAKSQGIQYIYLKAIDKQNNVTCVKIDPVVVYGQSSLKTAAAEFDLDAQADIDVTMNLEYKELDRRFEAITAELNTIRERAQACEGNYDVHLNEFKLELSETVKELFGMDYHYDIDLVKFGVVEMDRDDFLKNVDALCSDLSETLDRILLYREENAYTVCHRINAINRLNRNIRRIRDSLAEEY